jgi:hypothetical protein
MKPTSSPPVTCRPARRLWLWGLLATPPLLLLLLGAGVASLFYLGSDFRALRNGLIKSSGVAWRQQFALNACYPVLGTVRAGLSLVELDPGARAALQSVQTAGVGVYQLASEAPQPDRAAMLAAADSAMTARGWERVVGVLGAHNLVAVYMPETSVSVHHLKCCVMVFDGREMVLVSVQGNPQALLKYAMEQTTYRPQMPSLAVMAR